MPPALYYYANFGTIKKNIKFSSAKVYDRPDLRDLEWDLFYHYSEARGFSGFKYDDVYSSHRILLDPDVTDDFLLLNLPETLNSKGERKTYVPARDYMRKLHPTALGPPLFDNEKKNLMLLGSRDLGKSFAVGVGMVGHMFLFPPAANHTKRIPTEVLVGASISDKSRDLLKKTKDSFDFLPGKRTISGRTYPSPFYKQYSGSWSVNSDIKAEYKKKVDGRWDTVGSRAVIKHRSFNENPFAAQGTRPDLMVIEEAGMAPELKDIYVHSVDALRRGLTKTGTLLVLGTGGDMAKGTLPASEMFYEPEKYDFLAFEDIYEQRGKICYFIPAYYSLDEFRNANGYVDVEKATKKLLNVRKLKGGDSGASTALDMEMQYRPLVPSEMFLSKTANIFPFAELRRRLSEIQATSTYEKLEKKVDLFFDPSAKSYNGVSYEINDRLNPITTFPYDGDDREGAVVIYEFPQLIDDKVPQDAYIIGCDPYKDDTQEGQSLAAIYVVKTSKYFSTIGHDEIVASYIGRPYMGKVIVNEILHKLSLFYGNAKIYFENSVGNVKDYFERVTRLDLLATQPTTLFNKKASYNTSPTLIYGYPMPNQRVKWEALQYLRTWLLTDRGDGKRNLDLISDPALLQELISFNLDGNFDRVMGLVGCVIGLEETFNHTKRSQEREVYSSALDLEIISKLTNNKALFYENFPKAKTSIFA